ncbi:MULTISPECIES: NUDIX hydrolase [unclassified Nocardioides]|uniref:NUDIX hydrolase n=1 Tax=unclassified Nocardioides TaxID=2615069 RepID=UPI002664E80D|nr:NUDIX domain-containing protein [Nocardioides sp. Arc9.136]WKN46727.1 NUDIX domain-containing protein [Nocardioides sp. Arc9.136]
MGGSTRPVRERVCARVLPVNTAGEVLLLHGWDPADPGSPYWFTIGGGTEPGESLVEAAAREMHEESGLRVDPGALVGPLHRETVGFDWGPWHLVQDQTYFAVRVDLAPGQEVHLGGLEPLEVGTIDRAAWWTPAALDEDGTAVSEELTTIMRTAVTAVGGGST